MAIDRVRHRDRLRRGVEMCDDLMTEQVEIDPGLGAAPLGAAQHATVKGTRGGDVVDGKGEVERAELHERAINRFRHLRHPGSLDKARDRLVPGSIVPHTKRPRRLR
jgi:hypothetical protein